MIWKFLSIGDEFPVVLLSNPASSCIGVDRNPGSSVFELKKRSIFHSVVEVLGDLRFDSSIFPLDFLKCLWDFIGYVSFDSVC